jgi:hypothetical protein
MAINLHFDFEDLQSRKNEKVLLQAGLFHSEDSGNEK